MNINKLAILGGSGFVGSSLANLLAQHDLKVRVPTRSRERARHLWVLPNTELVECNIHDQNTLTEVLTDCDVVINLVGILNERKDDGVGFRAVHVELTDKIIKACKANRIGRLLHMSALNADPFGHSYYLRTKAQAEDLLTKAADDGLRITIFRPSVIFGPGDDFLNRFAQLLRLSPLVFPLACPDARFQPVYVGDVAEAFFRALGNPDTYGQRYDLGGPVVKTLAELVKYVAETIGLKRCIVPLGPRLSRAQANILEYFPGKPFSRDNYRSMHEDSVCRGDNGLTQLGIAPTALDAVVPKYLGPQSDVHLTPPLRSSTQENKVPST